MSIILSVPPAIVQEARAFVKSRGTSLNAMIRDFLSRVASADARKRDAAGAFREIAASISKRKGGRAYRFSRADAYDRAGFP